MSTKETLAYIDSEGGDLDSTVFDPTSNVTVDGVPNDATSFDEIPESDEGDSGDGSGDTGNDDGADGGSASTEMTSVVDDFDPESLVSSVGGYDDRDDYQYVNSDIGPIDDETNERARSELQAMLSNARDEEVATEMAERMGYIADEVDRAFAAPTEEGGGAFTDPLADDASVVAFEAGQRASTVNHEFGHALAYAFGFDGTEREASHDMDYFPEMDNPLERIQYAVGRSKGNIPQDLDTMMSRVREEVDSGDSQETVSEAMERVQELDDAESRMEEYVKAANRAFHRQHVADDQGGMAEAGEYIIKDRYSTTNAHEVLSRTNEILQGGREAKLEPGGLRTLANSHPDLLGSYLALFEPSDAAQEYLADTVGVEV
jgi:hypothetical protein